MGVCFLSTMVTQCIHALQPSAASKSSGFCYFFWEMGSQQDGTCLRELTGNICTLTARLNQVTTRLARPVKTRGNLAESLFLFAKSLLICYRELYFFLANLITK